MKHLKFLLLSACLFSLAACQAMDDVMTDMGATGEPFFTSGETPPAEQLIGGGNCPQAKVVDELGAYSEFTDPRRPRESDLITRVYLKDIERTCDYAAKSVTVDLSLEFQGMLGPMGRVNSGDKPFFSYPFFVAVTSPGGQILAKEVFAASMTYAPGQDRQTYAERLRQIIPVPTQNRGARYNVLVGFQLSEEQLAYNREEIRKEMEAREAAEKARKSMPAAAQAAPGASPAEPAALPAPVEQPVTLTAPSPY